MLAVKARGLEYCLSTQVALQQCALVIWEGGDGASPGLAGQPVLSSQPNPSAVEIRWGVTEEDTECQPRAYTDKWACL